MIANYPSEVSARCKYLLNYLLTLWSDYHGQADLESATSALRQTPNSTPSSKAEVQFLPIVVSQPERYSQMETPNVAPAIAVLTSPAAESLDFTKFNVELQKSFVVPHNAKVSEMVGYRHAVIRYRVVGKTAVDKPAKMATIPQIKLDADNYLLPKQAETVLLGVLEDQQDGMIRDMIESGKNTIAWEDVTLEKTLAALTATRISNRLTREIVEFWADAAIRPATDKRAQQVAEAKGFANDPAKLSAQQAATFNAYKDNLAKLAAAVPNLGMETANQLDVFMKASALDDDIAKVLKRKLHAILNPAAASEDL